MAAGSHHYLEGRLARFLADAAAATDALGAAPFCRRFASRFFRPLCRYFAADIGTTGFRTFLFHALACNEFF